MRTAAVVFCSCVLAAAAIGQSAPEVRSSSHPYQLAPFVFSTAARRVAVDVVVRKTDGALVPGLTRNDFRIEDNGHPRALSGFIVVHGPRAPRPSVAPAAESLSQARSPNEGSPRSVALFFDDVNTNKGDLAHARNAAERFISEALDPSDWVAIFTASGRQSLPFTQNPAQLLATIARLTVHPRHDRRFGTCPHITPYQAYQIVRLQGGMALQAALAEKQACDVQNGLVDDYSGASSVPGFDNQSFQVMADANAIWDETRAASRDTLASIEDVVAFLGQQPGRRMLLVASGGFLTGTLGAMRSDIVQQALQSRVVINSLDARGLYTEAPGRGPDYVPDVSELPLPTYFYEESSHLGEQMAQEEPLADLAESTGGLFFHNNNDLTVGFRRLGLIPAITYELTFDPGAIAHDGSFHKIKVTLVPKSNAIIQARPGYYAPAPTSSINIQATLDNAMRASTSDAGLPATISPQPESGGLRINIHFDAAHMPFQNEKGRRRLNLIFIAGLFNPAGKFIVGKQADMDMALKSATYEHLLAQGLNVNLSLQAPRGAYRLRVVIADASGAHLFAASQGMTIP